MIWNYRVMRHITANSSFEAIHEVFYDPEGQVINWTKSPAAPARDLSDPDASLAEDLRHMEEALALPVLDFESGQLV